MVQKQLTKLGSIGVLAVLALCLSIGATPKTMTKAFTIRGHVEGQFRANSLTLDFVDIGVASHAGRYLNLGQTTMAPDFGSGTGYGTWTEANGDQLTWTAILGVADLHVTATGGTGKYAGVTGGFDGTISNLTVDLTTGAISYDYVGTGKLTY